MVEGVIAAAGFSSRAGGWKMAFDLDGLTVIERSVLGMVPYCSRVFVIGGSRFDLLKALLPKDKYPTVELIENPDYHRGMFSSVLTGFRQVSAERFFFLPGDYPCVAPAVYPMLLDAEGETIIPTYQGRTGHPVLFETGAARSLLTEPDKYANLRDFVQSRHTKIIDVTDPGILMDIDTQDDYLRAVGYFKVKS